jgi:hypothetical protein
MIQKGSKSLSAPNNQYLFRTHKHQSAIMKLLRLASLLFSATFVAAAPRDFSYTAPEGLEQRQGDVLEVNLAAFEEPKQKLMVPTVQPRQSTPHLP